MRESAVDDGTDDAASTQQADEAPSARRELAAGALAVALAALPFLVGPQFVEREPFQQV